MVDAAAEAERLRENAEAGKPVTAGETPTIKRREKALLEGVSELTRRGRALDRPPIHQYTTGREAGCRRLLAEAVGPVGIARATAATLTDARRPVRRLSVAAADARAIGAPMMHFMLETVVAAHLLGVDRYDQPAVERGKGLVRRYLEDEP